MNSGTCAVIIDMFIPTYDYTELIDSMDQLSFQHNKYENVQHPT